MTHSGHSECRSGSAAMGAAFTQYPNFVIRRARRPRQLDHDSGPLGLCSLLEITNLRIERSLEGRPGHRS
jgi:hypothetical protein